MPLFIFSPSAVNSAVPFHLDTMSIFTWLKMSAECSNFSKPRKVSRAMRDGSGILHLLLRVFATKYVGRKLLEKISTGYSKWPEFIHLRNQVYEREQLVEITIVHTRIL